MFDSHAHVSDKAFADDREQILARAQVAGVRGWIEIGTDVVTSQQAIVLAGQSENVWATVGVHPYDAANITEADWKTLEQLTKQPKVVAIGEVGFDFSRQENTQEQWTALEKFIALAKKGSGTFNSRYPLVFHVRDGKGLNAHENLLELLRSYSATDRPRGVIHTYSGTWEQAQEYLKLGMYLSISGVVTFKNSGAMAEVAAKMPLDKMLLETDCPYLTPEPHRGQRNEPAYINSIAQKVAKLRQEPLEAMQSATFQNTQELFGIKMA